MSNGEDAADEDESAEDAPAEITEESLNDRLDAIAEDLEAAETEDELDVVESELDDVEADLERADLPEPDDEDEDAPADEIQGRIDDLRSDLEEARGPYTSDVIERLEEAAETIEETRWTETGETEVAAAVDDFADVVADVLGADVHPETADVDAQPPALEEAAVVVGDADLHADDDAETIATLLEAAETLQDDLDAAEEWDDLETKDKLLAQGYYDVLGHYKDYPVEWSALKEHRSRGNTDMVLLALESLQSDFMEEHCLDALAQMGKRAATEDAIDAMLQRAGKRDKPGIEILGKMAAPEAVDTILEYVDNESNPQLQRVVFKALGEIGAEEAVQPIAEQLHGDNDDVRPHAARALGLIGDPRAIDPLADVLEEDDHDDTRAAAAWALRQIGTEEALEAAAGYTDEMAFTIQSEAEKAREALDAPVTGA